MITLIINDEDMPAVLDCLRTTGALEIDNATTPETEERGIHLRDLADRLERQVVLTYEVAWEGDELHVLDSLGNEVRCEVVGGIPLNNISVHIGQVEYFVRWMDEEHKNINAWIVEEADIDLDRRAATGVELQLFVGKLSDQDTVHRLLTKFREEVEAA